MQRTYTDRHVRAALRAVIAKASYRRVADASGIDVAQLHRTVNGKQALTAKVCALVGFDPVDEPRRWVRSTPKQPGA